MASPIREDLSTESSIEWRSALQFREGRAGDAWRLRRPDDTRYSLSFDIVRG